MAGCEEEVLEVALQAIVTFGGECALLTGEGSPSKLLEVRPRIGATGTASMRVERLRSKRPDVQFRVEDTFSRERAALSEEGLTKRLKVEPRLSASMSLKRVSRLQKDLM